MWDIPWDKVLMAPAGIYVAGVVVFLLPQHWRASTFGSRPARPFDGAPR